MAGLAPGRRFAAAVALGFGFVPRFRPLWVVGLVRATSTSTSASTRLVAFPSLVLGMGWPGARGIRLCIRLEVEVLT